MCHGCGLYGDHACCGVVGGGIAVYGNSGRCLLASGCDGTTGLRLMGAGVAFAYGVA